MGNIGGNKGKHRKRHRDTGGKKKDIGRFTTMDNGKASIRISYTS